MIRKNDLSTDQGSAPGNIVLTSFFRRELPLARPLVLVAILGLLVSFVGPFALQAVIDRVIVFKIPATLVSIVVILIVAAIFEAILTLLRGRISGFLAGRITAGIATAVVSAAMRQPTTTLLGEKGREVIATLGEFHFFRDGVNQLISFFVQILFSVVFYLCVLLLLNPGMTLAVLLTLPFHALIYWKLARDTREKVQKSVATNSEFLASTQTAISAIETIHAYGLAERQTRTSRKLIVEALFRGFEARDATNTAQSVSRFVSRLTEAAVIALGAMAVMQNDLTLGELVVFQMLLSRMVQPISQAGVTWDRYYRLKTILDGWQSLMDNVVVPEGVQNATPVANAPILVAENLSLKYPGAKKSSLDDVNFRIDGGEIVFLLGASGSGKSTLVRLLAGLVQPSSGAIQVKGIAPMAVSEDMRHKLVAAAFQEPVLLPGSIAGNIASFDENMSLETIRQKAETAGAAEFIDRLPERYDTLVGMTGYSVSGGERQRICLARMLAADASLMIIDEGTSGLQRSLEVSVIERIKAGLRQDQALIVITHREDLMQMGTRAIRLDTGQIIDDTQIGDNADAGNKK
jgi:ABC-type bacteriocin/lantibiotic exporter with double-glycine peptidase domain